MTKFELTVDRNSGTGTGLLTRRRFTGWVSASAAASIAFGGLRSAAAATSVNVMSWQGYEDPLGADGFLAKNSAEVKATYISANEDILTKLKAGGIGSVDLGTPERKYVFLMIENDVLQPIDPDRVPNLKRAMPFFANQPSLRRDGKLYAVPFTWGMLPLVYRSDLVTEVPTSWRDVMKPEYKGKVVMVGGMVGVLQIWARVATGTDTPTMITPAELKETIDLLIKIKKEHARTVATSWGEMADVMARGEAVIATCGWEPVVLWVAKKGAKLAAVYPKEGTTGFIDTYVLPKGAPNPDLAVKLIDNALSVAGQKLIADKMGQGIINLDAIAELTPEQRLVYPYDNMETMTKTARFYPMPPLEPDGKHATYGDMVKEWDRFKRA